MKSVDILPPPHAFTGIIPGLGPGRRSRPL